MSDIEVTGGIFPHVEGFITAAGIMAHVHDIAEGTLLDKHKHDYDHLSILARGTAVVTLLELGDLEEETHVMSTGQCLLVKAGRSHQILAVTDIVWYCIHPKGAE